MSEFVEELRMMLDTIQQRRAAREKISIRIQVEAEALSHALTLVNATATETTRIRDALMLQRAHRLIERFNAFNRQTAIDEEQVVRDMTEAYNNNDIDGWEGIHKGTYLGIPATNKTVTLSFVDVLDFEAGKIKLSKLYINMRRLEQALRA